MASTGEQPGTSSERNVPQDVEAVRNILKDMGVSDYEPRVVEQLLEFAYRHVSDLLEDASVYADHAGRQNVNTDDVKLAIQLQTQKTYKTPPPRELIAEIARERNAMDLHPRACSEPGAADDSIESGLNLPNDRHCLLHPNYKLRPTRQVLVATQRFNPAAGLRGSVMHPPGASRMTSRFRQPAPPVTSQLRAYRPRGTPMHMAASAPNLQTLKKEVPVSSGVTGSSRFRIVPGGTSGSMKRKREDDDLDDDYDDDD